MKKTQLISSAILFVLLCATQAFSQTNSSDSSFKHEPSSAADLVSKKSNVKYDPSFDAKRKAAMSAEELAWETVLEQNLGDFYLPIYKNDKQAGKETAWDFVKDDPQLPRVLLIGDSISRGYTLVVRHALAGKANVHRAPANCGPTATGLKDLSIWLGQGKWDVVHFNFGIHDRNTPDEIYAANLEKILKQLEDTGAKLIWARTTPPASAANSEKFSPAQCDRVNRIADGIMKHHGVPEDDLYSLVQPRLDVLQIANSVHFKEEGYEVIGQQVAKEILTCLSANKN